MALIHCPECGKEISDKAPACIHCGCPLSPIPSEATEPDRFTLFLSYCPSYPDVRSKAIRALSDELNYSPEDAKAMVRTALRSPVPCGSGSPRRRPRTWPTAFKRQEPASKSPTTLRWSAPVWPWRFLMINLPLAARCSRSFWAFLSGTGSRC